MAKKNKSSKKKQLRDNKVLLNMSTEDLVKNGQSFFSAGNARKAIELFKLAGKKNGWTDEIRTGLFKAYGLRADQLTEKGLIVEADVLKKQMNEYRPSAKNLSPQEFETVVQYLSDRDAISAYNSYLKDHKGPERIESILAGRIFVSGKWDLLNSIEGDSPLKEKIPVIREAVLKMKEADWESALLLLKDIPRSSPYSQVRIFAKAMVSFYSNDNKALKKSVEMLPEAFPLQKTAAALLPNDEQFASSETVLPVCNVLYDGPFHVSSHIKRLTEAVSKEKLKQIPGLVSDISKSLFPDDPIAAQKYIMEVVCAQLHRDGFYTDEIDDVLKQVLPENEKNILLAKLGAIVSSNPLRASAVYLSLLGTEFSDPDEQKIASSQLIYATVKNLLYQTEKIDELFENYINSSGPKISGIKPGMADDMMIDLVSKGILLDPENREGYEILSGLPRYSKYALNQVEEMLRKMTGYFPGDPYPYLILSDVYHEKHAYRKAEKALGEALEIAPHDTRVIDRQIMALLYAASRNIKKENLPLARKDLDKAKSFERAKFIPHIAVKTILWEIYSSGKPDLLETIERGISDFNPLNRLKTLVLFSYELKRNKKRSPTFEKTLKTLFSKEKKTVYSLSSLDALNLLMPPDELTGKFLSYSPPLPVMLKYHPNILDQLTDTDLIRLFETSFDSENYSHFTGQIKKRIKKATPVEKEQLNFCMAVIRSVTENIYDSELFTKITDQADAPLQDVLRQLSAKLSRFADFPLKAALQSFRFELLDMPPIPDFLFDDPYGEDDFEDDYFEDDPEELLKNYDKKFMNEALHSLPDYLRDEMIMEVEYFIDDFSLRGVSDSKIKKKAVLLQKTGAMPSTVIIMKNFANHPTFKGLSREARVFLNGLK